MLARLCVCKRVGLGRSQDYRCFVRYASEQALAAHSGYETILKLNILTKYESARIKNSRVLDILYRNFNLIYIS